MKRNKISIVGSGFTGTTTALMLAQKELGNIVLVDLPQSENQTKGKALDMLQSSPIFGYDVSIEGTANYADIAGSDVVIVTAGIARKPEMSRDDLVNTNAGIIKSVAQEIKTYAPDAFVLVLSNPVDAMTYTMYKETGFPKERVIGQSGVLDTARYRTFIAEELNVSVKDVIGFVLGGHGDDMVPLIRYSSVGGIPVETMIDENRLAEIIERTRKGGGEIVGLLGNGSAYYAPAAALVEMTEAIIKDQRRILPAIAYLDGEYSFSDMYFGVPVILGGNGIEEIIELQLTDTEQKALEKSAQSVRNVLDVLPEFK